MNQALSVSQATIEDLDQLVNLFDQYRIFYGQASDLQAARAFLFDRFAQRESVVFVAKDPEGGKAVGFTQLYPAFSSISMQRSLVLNDLYVLEEYRGRGAAQLLLDAAKAYGKQTKAKGLELSTAVGNKRARRIYERNGYEIDNDFVHYFLSLKE